MKLKKTPVFFMALLLVMSLFLTMMPVYAVEEEMATKQETVFAGWFRKIVQRFSLTFKKENNRFPFLGGKKNPSSTPKTRLNGDAGQKEQLTDEDRLTKLVANGNITEAQKTEILAELATLKAVYGEDALKGLTQQARMKKLQEMKETLKNWAIAHGIAVGFVMPELSGNGQEQDKSNIERNRVMQDKVTVSPRTRPTITPTQ